MVLGAKRPSRGCRSMALNMSDSGCDTPQRVPSPGPIWVPSTTQAPRSAATSARALVMPMESRSPGFTPAPGSMWSISSMDTSQIGMGDPGTPHEPTSGTDALLCLVGLSGGHVASSVEAGAAWRPLCPPQNQGWLLALPWASQPSLWCQFGVLLGGTHHSPFPAGLLWVPRECGCGG